MKRFELILSFVIVAHHMKKLAFVLIFLLTVGVSARLGAKRALAAQQTQAPDILTSQLKAGADLQNYKAWAEGQINSLWAIVNAQSALIQQLDAQAKICPSPVIFNTAPGGPIGSYQCLVFSSGNWIVSNGELAPALEGQPQRSITFPRSVMLTSIVFSTTTAATTGIVLTAPNFSTPAIGTANPIGQDTTFLPNFAGPVSSITVAGEPSSGKATDLRIRSISYQ